MKNQYDDATLSSYEECKKHREMELEYSINQLNSIAKAYRDRADHVAIEAFKLGLKFGIRKIEETELLLIKAQEELTYTNPKEAEREHRNQMNTLACLKHILVKRYEGRV
jgi:hypothetical protein